MRVAVLAIAFGGCLAASAAKAELVVNGGFEEPAIGTQFVTFWAGDANVTGWTIVSGSVDIVDESFGEAFEGSQWLDLNGSSPGSVQQTFATEVGVAYSLSFAYANNPMIPSASATVTVSGASSGDMLDVVVSHQGSNANNMGFDVFQATFVANSKLTTLMFSSLTSPWPTGGIALDAVSVAVVSAPAACPGDVNGDGMVDGADLGSLLTGWGQPGPTDIDGNGITDGADLGALLTGWGACPE